MSVIGGSVESCSLRGRQLAPAADADVTIFLGGYSNAGEANGNGSTRMIKTRETPRVEGLKVACDLHAGDHLFLKEVADGHEFVTFTITLAGGETVQGKAQIGDMPGYSTQSATVELTLIGENDFTLQ